MTMHPQAITWLEILKDAELHIENPTLEQMRADPADWLGFAGPMATDVIERNTYFTSPTADLHAVIFTPKNVKPNAPVFG